MLRVAHCQLGIGCCCRRLSVANVYCAFRLHFTFLPYTAAMAINCCCTHTLTHTHSEPFCFCSSFCAPFFAAKALAYKIPQQSNLSLSLCLCLARLPLSLSHVCLSFLKSPDFISFYSISLSRSSKNETFFIETQLSCAFSRLMQRGRALSLSPSLSQPLSASTSESTSMLLLLQLPHQNFNYYPKSVSVSGVASLHYINLALFWAMS